MLKIVTKLLDLLYPPRATELLVRETAENEISSLYSPRTHEGILYLLPYQHPSVKALIKENKFHNNPLAQELLARTVDTWIITQHQKSLIFIPIPLSKKRERERGHNQVHSVLNRAKHATSWYALTRIHHTKPQTELSRNERLDNLKGAFSFDTKTSLPKATHFVIIDDVLTTGATLRAARAELARHLPKDSTLTCLALAH